jgi:microcin C transport system permease protein
MLHSLTRNSSYFSKRIFLGVVQIALLLLVCFFLTGLLPGGPLDGLRIGSEKVSPEIGSLSIDWTESTYYREPVARVLLRALPPTLLLSLLSLFGIYLLGVPLGLFLSVKQEKRIGRVLSFALLVLSSLPPVLLGMALLLFFSSGLIVDIFPLQGWRSFDSESFSLLQRTLDTLWHLVLPTACFVLLGVGPIALLVRNFVSEEMSEPYTLAGRARGNSERNLLLRYGLYRSLLPLSTHLGRHVAFLLSGTLFVEVLFGIPGFGLLAFQSVLRRDYPVMLAVIFLAGILQVLGNLLSDILHTFLDPRVRLSGGQTA